MNLTPKLRGKVERYKAKRAALEVLRDAASSARDEADACDEALTDAERELQNIRKDLLEDLEAAALAGDTP